MAPTLYMVWASPPARAVLFTAEVLGLKLNLKEVDIMGGEHKNPEYLKMNPQHTVPVLVDDDGFTIWDSHAIMPYLVAKYGKTDVLYPKDIKKRATIDQRLHFENNAFAIIRKVGGQVISGSKSIDEVDKTELFEVYQMLEAFLEGKEWMAGNFLSIADYSIFSSIGSTHLVFPVDAQKYPKLTAWMKKVEALPELAINKKGVEAFLKIFNKNK